MNDGDLFILAYVSVRLRNAVADQAAADDGPEVVTTRPLCLALLRHPLHDLCCLCYHMDSFVSLGHPDHAFLFGHDDHTADPRKRTPSARVSDIPAVYIGS